MRTTRRSPWRTLAASVAVVMVGAGCSGSTGEAQPARGTVGPISATTTVTATTTGPASTAAAASTAPASVPATTSPLVPVPTFADASGFDDHTVPRVVSVAEFMALARSDRTGQSVVKFAFTDAAVDFGPVHFYDSSFYKLHDEWYFYRLLNGKPVEGALDEPWSGRTFDTVEEITAWAEAMPPDDLPLGLTFAGERLYSPAFYDGALYVAPRRFGAGSIVRFTPSKPGASVRWLVELEYGDPVTPDWIATVMRRVSATLPTEIATSLSWVVRAPDQEVVASAMQAKRLEFHDRIARYADLVEPGATAVYSEGIAAGRLRYVGPDDQDRDLTSVQPGDIVITEHVPDWLPPANAFITSDPQTPLAHVNLLARNRGIPNLSRAGIHTDLAIRRAADVRAHAVVVAHGDTATIALITPAQYEAWVDLRVTRPISVPSVDLTSMPMVLDLTELSADLSDDGLTSGEIDQWRPVVGGKSAGFLSLLAAPGLTPPVHPMAITIRPYVEHIASVRLLIADAITDPAFANSPRARWLVLEGTKGYDERFSTPADAEFAAMFASAHQPGTPIGDVVAKGGVREIIEDRPIDSSTLRSITESLMRAYDDHAGPVALRFRSSSSVEDIEGFNGAGLYTSTTGFLRPSLVTVEKDRNNTIERALVRAWSSYWAFGAFEERRLESIDHLSGAMGLTVHARFEDDLERNNGVATFTFAPGREPDDAELEINVQTGSTPVTNPDPSATDLPEVIRVRRVRGEVSIERISSSTLSDALVMDEEAVTELFAQTSAVAAQWRDRLNAGRESKLRVQTTVLDFEFKTMGAGWPAVTTGEPYPERLVLRQVRSLDPGLRDLPPAVRSLPTRHDVLMRAAKVIRARCTVSGRTTEYTEVLTDPLRRPDMGYSEVPFVGGERPASDEGCARTTLYASPDQYLLGLLDRPDVFVVSGATVNRASAGAGAAPETSDTRP